MSKKFVYTPEMLAFLEANVEGTPLKELADRFNMQFGTDRTRRQLLDTLRARGWRNGLLHEKKVFPQEVCDFVQENYKGRRAGEMAKLLNETFGKQYTEDQLSRYYCKHGLRCGVGSTFVPVGTVILRKTENKYYEKVMDGPNPAENWKPKHVLVWEEEHGPVPAGCVLIFLDGNQRNYDIKNLALCSQAVALELNRRKLRFTNADATKTGVLIAQLNTEIFKKQKERRAEHER